MSYPVAEARAYMRDRYAEQRTQFIQWLGGKCVKCNTTNNLQFDHIDPKTKSFGIGALWGGINFRKSSKS